MTAVIHVVTALERGGAQRNTLETVARLHDPGRPQLLVTGAEAELDDEAHQRLGRRLLRVPELVGPIDPVRDLLAVQGLLRVFQREAARWGKPVVVHTHSSKAGVLGRLAARAIPGVWVVHTVHGFGLDALGPRHAWLLTAVERIAARAADVMVFVSDADRRRAAELGLLEGLRVEVIRSGIDADAWAGVRGHAERRLQTRAALGIAPDAPLAVTTANLQPQKDPLLHAEIFAAWRAMDPRARMVFLGDGPLRGALEARLGALGLRHAFLLPGFVADPRDHLAAADVFLLASAWEGLPRAVLEATAAGLPAVVRDTGWAGDLAWARSVRPLPSDAPPAVYAALLNELLVKKPRVPRLPREFTQTGMLEDLERLYDSLIGPPRYPRGTVKPRPPGRRRRR